MKWKTDKGIRERKTTKQGKAECASVRLLYNLHPTGDLTRKGGKNTRKGQINGKRKK